MIVTLQDRDHPAIESQAKLQVISKVSQVFESEAQQQAVVNSLENFGATVERATTQAYDRFQRWFGSAQDRAEQWFQTHVRIVTIVFAILTAFLLQLDNGDIYRQLHDQPKLVDALVQSAPGFVEQGGKDTRLGRYLCLSRLSLMVGKASVFRVKAASGERNGEGVS